MRGHWLRGALTCACALATLAGCNGILPAAAQRLPPLHIAGLRRMDGLSNLNGASGFPDFAHETPFRQGAGAWQVLLDGEGEGLPLAVASQDGSKFRMLALNNGCLSLVGISANGQWVVCFDGDPNTGASYIEVAPFNGNRGLAQRRIPATVSYLFVDPIFALSPDGYYLSVVEPTVPDCAIVTYAFSADHSSATVATTLTSPAFHNTTECPVSALAWSSDGARLSIVLSRDAPLQMDAAEPIARLIQTHTAERVIPQSTFARLPGFGTPTPIINPRDGRIAFISHSGLVVLTPTVGRPAFTRLEFPSLDYRVWSAEWTPDGKSLLLVIGPPMCVDRCDWGNYVRDVYLYTAGATPGAVA
jgi:hypothetical protein